MDYILDYPYLIFLKFFPEALPAAAFAYGLVWLVMRPKSGKKIDNPFLWHTCGVAVILVASAVFRIVAMVTFAGRGAYEPVAETGAAGFYTLIVPALFAAVYFTWLKKNKLSAPHDPSEHPASPVSLSPPTISATPPATATKAETRPQPPQPVTSSTIRGFLMNDMQRKVLIAVGVAIFLFLLYPPYRTPNGATVYSWLFSPPYRGEVNVATLLVQWLGVSLVGAIAFFLTKAKP